MKTIFTTIAIFIILIGGLGYAVKDSNIPLLSMVGQDISTKILGQEILVTKAIEPAIIDTQSVDDLVEEKVDQEPAEVKNIDNKSLEEENNIIEEVTYNENGDEVITQTNEFGTVSLTIEGDYEDIIDSSFVSGSGIDNVSDVSSLVNTNELANGFLINSELPDDVECSIGINNTYVVCTSLSKLTDYFRSLPLYPEDSLVKNAHNLAHHEIPKDEILKLENRYSGSSAGSNFGEYSELELELVDRTVGIFDVSFEEKKDVYIKIQESTEETSQDSEEVDSVNNDRVVCGDDMDCFQKNLSSCTSSILNIEFLPFTKIDLEILGIKNNSCVVAIYGYLTEDPLSEKVTQCSYTINEASAQFNKLLNEEEAISDQNCTQRNLTDSEFEDANIEKKQEIKNSCGSGDIGDIFIDNFQSCTPSTCEFYHPFTGEIMERNILGLDGDTCIYVENMPEGKKMSCTYSTNDRIIAAEAYRDINEGGSEGNSILSGFVFGDVCNFS